MQPAPTYLGLAIYEWLTIAAILLGPILAVATQLWFQARKAKRDAKVWVFNTLMGLRPQILHVDFVKAFNMIDVVFYSDEVIRKGRREFMAVASSAANRDLSPNELERMNDLLAEMLAKIGKELGLEFDHTEIKNTGYYPKGFLEMQNAVAGIIKHGVAVLEGKENIGVAIKELSAPGAPQPSAPAPAVPAAPAIQRR
jgi:hypothetical protein